ncbi:MAG: glycosyltransferase family 2 protein [Acidimicrobiales bacterium]
MTKSANYRDVDGIRFPDLEGARTGVYRLSVVLPAFNEEENVLEAIARVTDVTKRLCAEYEIIVVDDGSSDRTAELVQGASRQDSHVRLVRHSRNKGYGEALRSGFRAARLELVFFTDADNQFDLDELEGFLPWIERVNVVAGYRIKRQDPFMRRLTARTWNQVVRALFCVPVHDIDCAFKLFRRSVFDEIDLDSVGAMVNTELMVKLQRSGAGVIEMGVHHFPRRAGQARGANPRVIARALFELATMYRRLHRAGVLEVPPIFSSPTAMNPATDDPAIPR